MVSNIFIYSSTTSDHKLTLSNPIGNDTIIGIVSLELKELFALRSQITRWFDMVGVNGSGKTRISLLLKPIDVDISPSKF